MSTKHKHKHAPFHVFHTHTRSVPSDRHTKRHRSTRSTHKHEPLHVNHTSTHTLPPDRHTNTHRSTRSTHKISSIHVNHIQTRTVPPDGHTNTAHSLVHHLQPLYRNVPCFRGGLVCKAHGLVYHLIEPLVLAGVLLPPTPRLPPA